MTIRDDDLVRAMDMMRFGAGETEIWAEKWGWTLPAGTTNRNVLSLLFHLSIGHCASATPDLQYTSSWVPTDCNRIASDPL
jgi:hypothetical protein